MSGSQQDPGTTIARPRPRRSSRLTPTQRQRLFRGGLYAALVLAGAGVVAVADFEALQANFLNLQVAGETMPLLVTRALRNTVTYTVIAFSIGLVLGLLLALMKLSPVRPYRWLANIYIEFLRGLPAILTISLVGFGIPIAFGVRIPGGTPGAGTLALGLVAAAYMAETIRAGIQAVPKGQVEAARSLGMSQGRAMISIVLPQAFRIIIPPLTNEVVLLIKDTSLLFVIGFQPVNKELYVFARDIAQDFANSTPFIAAGLAYLAITLPLTRVVAALERKQQRAR
jgi:polar amino acid transport system permease protein